MFTSRMQLQEFKNNLITLGVYLLHEVDGDVRGDTISGAEPQVGLVSPCPREPARPGHGQGVAAPTPHLRSKNWRGQS